MAVNEIANPAFSSRVQQGVVLNLPLKSATLQAPKLQGFRRDFAVLEQSSALEVSPTPASSSNGASVVQTPIAQQSLVLEAELSFGATVDTSKTDLGKVHPELMQLPRLEEHTGFKRLQTKAAFASTVDAPTADIQLKEIAPPPEAVAGNSGVQVLTIPKDGNFSGVLRGRAGNSTVLIDGSSMDYSVVEKPNGEKIVTQRSTGHQATITNVKNVVFRR